MPSGAIIVKENYTPAGELAATTVMYKKSGYNPDHNDWFWINQPTTLLYQLCFGSFSDDYERFSHDFSHIEAGMAWDCGKATSLPDGSHSSRKF